jgi:hypothetical protein
LARKRPCPPGDFNREDNRISEVHMRKKRSKPFKPTQSENPRLPRPSMRPRKVVPQKERTPEERERALMQPVISMEPLCRKQSKPPLPAARRMGKTGWTGVPPKQREGATREPDGKPATKGTLHATNAASVGRDRRAIRGVVQSRQGAAIMLSIELGVACQTDTVIVNPEGQRVWVKDAFSSKGERIGTGPCCLESEPCKWHKSLGGVGVGYPPISSERVR